MRIPKQSVAPPSEPSAFDSEMDGADESDDPGSDDWYSDDLYSEDAYSGGMNSPSAAATSPSKPALPPRSGQPKRKKPSQRRRKATVDASHERDLNDLTPGTYGKRYYFSEAGQQLIVRMLIAIGGMAFTFGLIYFVHLQFVAEGLVDPVVSEPVVPKPVPSADEILAGSLDHVRTAAESLAVTDRPRREWNHTARDESGQWNLALDPAPAADYPKILSHSRYDRTTTPADFTARWIQLTDAAEGVPVYLDVQANRGRRLSDKRADVSSRRNGARREVLSLSPDGRHVLQHFQAHGEEVLVGDSGAVATSSMHWTTLHEFDNTLVSLFPGVKSAEFVSDSGVVLFEPGSMSFFDLTTEIRTESIALRRGAVPLLSPGRRYAAVIEYDEKTMQRISEATQGIVDTEPSAAIRISVYDTRSGEQVAHGEFPETLGLLNAAWSRDGRRLAIRSGRDFRVVDMTTGRLEIRGQLPLEDIARSTYVDWLDGSAFLRVGSIIISAGSGQILDQYLTSADKKVSGGRIKPPNAWIAGRYVRNGPQGELHEYPIHMLQEIDQAVEDPARNVLSDRQVNLVFIGTDDPVIQEFVRMALERKSNFATAESSSPDRATVQVTYSERKADGPFSLDRWQPASRRERVDPPVRAWSEDQHEWEVHLSVQCLSPSGSRVASSAATGRSLPLSLDFTLPTEMQFRTASLFAAARDLDFLVPEVVWDSDPGFVVSEPWNAAARRSSVPAPEFEVDIVDVDNSWVSESHGLPVSN